MTNRYEELAFPPSTDREIIDTGIHRPYRGHDLVEEPLSTDSRSQHLEFADSAAKKPKPARVEALDCFRGLTIAWMILVDDAGSTYHHWMDHSPWNDVTLADFVFPFFVFIVGVSIAVSFKRQFDKGVSKREVFEKALIRFLKLYFIGMLSQSGQHPGDAWPYIDLASMRFCGILQRIGWCYFVTACVEIYLRPSADCDADDEYDTFTGKSDGVSYAGIFVRYRLQWLAFAVVFGVYSCLMFATQVPWCTGRGHLTENCNAAGYLDSKLFGYAHMYNTPTYRRSPECSSCSPGNCPRLGPGVPEWCYRAFDPEGAVTSQSAVLSCLLGLYFGHVLLHVHDPKERLQHWIPTSLVCFALGWIVHYSGFKMNKNLWSPSYVFFMAGVAGMVLSLFYFLNDISKIKVPFLPFKWMGMNAIFIFFFGTGVADALIEKIYVNDKDMTLIHLVRNHWFENWFGPDAGLLLFTLVKITFWFIVAWYLNKTRTYFKV